MDKVRHFPSSVLLLNNRTELLMIEDSTLHKCAPMSFRSDINALRAAAVVAVVLFHFNSRWFPGGFVGVDVFFVISGFLMTGIIFRGLEKGNFSVLGFYMARARRIIPALAVLCLSLMIFAFVFVIPKDFSVIAKHALSSLLFVSNFVYFGESGYFDASAHEKWLLHTWSLSVEWQFYMLYPLLILGARRFFGLDFARKLVLIGSLAGFAVCIFTSYRSASAAFYLLPSRAWEMMLGGVAYLFPLRLQSASRRIAEWVGWLAILGGCIFLKSTDIWPGYLAAIPVLGAFLVIQANVCSSFVSNNRAIQKVGEYSYSVYLWHWPIIVAAAYLQIDKTPVTMLLVLTLASAMSYLLVERRRPSGTAILSVALPAFTACALVYGSGGAGFRVGEEFRLSPQQYHATFYGGAGFPSNEGFQVGAEKNAIDAIMAGDSYGLQYAKFFDDTGKDRRLRFSTVFHHGCLILPNYTRYMDNKEDSSCSARYEELLAALDEDRTAPLIMAYSWDFYSANSGLKGADKVTTFENMQAYHELLSAQLEALINRGGSDRKYYLVGIPQPAESFAFRCLARAGLSGSRLLAPCREKEPLLANATNDALARFAETHDNVGFVNPRDVLCDGHDCLTISDGKPVHTDRYHLSTRGAEIVGSRILAAAGFASGDRNNVSGTPPH